MKNKKYQKLVGKFLIITTLVSSMSMASLNTETKATTSQAQNAIETKIDFNDSSMSAGVAIDLGSFKEPNGLHTAATGAVVSISANSKNLLTSPNDIICQNDDAVTDKFDLSQFMTSEITEKAIEVSEEAVKSMENFIKKLPDQIDKDKFIDAIIECGSDQEDYKVTVEALKIIKEKRRQAKIIEEEKRRIQEELQRQAEEAKKIAKVNGEAEAYPGYYDSYTNLRNKQEIHVDQIRSVIVKYSDNGTSCIFYENAQAFIDAANATGMDPLFFLALAALESGWGTNSQHVRKNNFYSINMSDSNPSGGYYLADNAYDGIVNGAIWIKDHYYDHNQQSIYTMCNGGVHSYCPNASWQKQLTWFMERFHSFIN